MHLFKPLLLVLLHLQNLTRVYSTIVGQNVEMHGEFGLCCCFFKPLFSGLFVNHWDAVLFRIKQRSIKNKTNCRTNSSTANKNKTAPGFLFNCRPMLILPFGAYSEFPLNRIDWIGALCFQSPLSPYNSPVMSDVTIALPWLSLNLHAQWLHQRAILQCSPGINLSWKQLVMNLDCLEKFSGWQLPWSAVTAGCLIHTWTPHQERDGERGDPSDLFLRWVFATV